MVEEGVSGKDEERTVWELIIVVVELTFALSHALVCWDQGVAS